MKKITALLGFSLWLYSGSLWAAQGAEVGYVGLSPMSGYAPNFVAPPIEAGFFLGDNWSFGAEYGQSSFDFGHDETQEDYHQGMMGSGWGSMLGERWESQETSLSLPTDATSKGVHTSYGAKVRWNLADHVQLQLASIQKLTNGTMEVPLNVTGATSKGDFKAQSQIATIGVGSWWRNDLGLFFGVDWAIGAKLLNQTVDITLQENLAASTAEQETARLQIEAFGKSLNQFLARSGGLNFFVGWQF